MAAAACVAGAPVLQSRAVVAHDSLSPLPEAIRSGTEGDGIKRFEPLLHIAHGCQPYPAVNEAGDTSGGLQDTGSHAGGCRDETKGQTYVRAAWHNGRFCIMYAWYWPKDQPNDGDVANGHRHDWEHVVVFIDDPAAATPTLIGASASSHSGYKKDSSPQRNGDASWSSTSPTHHQPRAAVQDQRGKEYPIIDWDMMTDATRNALNQPVFGDANCPFNEGNFIPKVEEAWV
ncbi:necrosis and ethylene-inducing protein [Macrophomina phaseolina]|uniref:Necrosis and ethylene-inducing protein n=1 Tax=Macrophomina phaseolina TaxID=35725 RepID=A0ABQ8G6D0_9PEZI|nr:necrosis and ethylene-inducing protein [Macrophomina phaseolina]